MRGRLLRELKEKKILEATIPIPIRPLPQFLSPPKPKEKKVQKKVLAQNTLSHARTEKNCD